MSIAIKTEGLTKAYVRGKKPAVDNLNLEVQTNTIFGFLGPNGAGKTTTINVLLGLLTPTSGKAWVLGEEIDSMHLKNRIGSLPESPYFYEHLTAREFLSFLANFFHMDSRVRENRIDELLKLVGLDDVSKLPLGKFSRGMLQRIGIAQALVNDPELVFLDEPITGLDPVGRKEVREIIMRVKEQEKTVFFCSHVLHDVELMCDEIGILCKGKLIKSGKLQDLLSTKETEISTYGLDAKGIESLKKNGSTISLNGQEVKVTVKEEKEVDDIIRIIESYGKNVSVEHHKETLEELFVREVEKVEKEGEQ